jgi:dTDP-4-dehydrorhamnose reductase
MRILVTGAKGMLGSDLCPVLAERHEVLATDIEEMDVRNYGLVLHRVWDYLPDVVMHLAALTNVDYCEQRPDEAFQTNAIGTHNVALACREVGATMVYISTISVFDGTKQTPYTEFDRPNPQSFYSRAKYEGERIVRSLLPKHYIVRAGWMFGGGPEDKKFVAKIVDLACSRPELKVVDDKFGSPTYTLDLSQGLARLLDTGLFGLYHMVNANGCISRYELARKILEYAGITGCRVTPVSSAEFPLPAPRPRMEAARNYHLELRGMDWMRDWQVALRSYLGRLYRLGEQRIVIPTETMEEMSPTVA